MSSTFTFYVVDESLLPPSLRAATDQATYDALVAEVKGRGARWAQIDASVTELNRALVLIDDEMGGTKFLPVFAFNNSPHDILGDDGDCPSFGYFDPEQARDLHLSLRDVAASIERAVDGDDLAEGVHHAVETTAQEAARRGHAMAILHDE